jgi:type VI protein secretion system component VasK
MAISPEGIAFLGTGAMIVVNVGGWVVSERRNKQRMAEAATEAAKTQAVEMSQLNNKFDKVQTDVLDIKKTLGNGGYTGIKQDIQKMQVNCAKEMAEVKTELSNLKSNSNGHGSG